MESELRLHRCCFTGHRPEKLNCTEAEAKEYLKSMGTVLNDSFLLYSLRMSQKEPSLMTPHICRRKAYTFYIDRRKTA